MQKLKTVDADTLLSTPLPANQPVVERLLPQGLHILAGASKVGEKLAGPLALPVRCGERGAGLGFDHRPGNRPLSLLWRTASPASRAGCSNSPKTRLPRCTSPPWPEVFGKGLEEQIEGFLQMHRDTVLVVIDTLQKVRVSNAAANPYAIDYQDLSSLKALADRYRLDPILAIHHIRKMQDDDPFNRISGTTGISGVADTNLVLLKQGRSGVDATLHCVGRDVEYQELHLKFQNCRWLLTEPLEEQKQEPASPEVLRLAEFLKGLESFDGTATEVGNVVGGLRRGDDAAQRPLQKAGPVCRELDKLGVHITTSRTRESRSLHLRCDSSDGSDGKKRDRASIRFAVTAVTPVTGAAYAPVRACVAALHLGLGNNPSPAIQRPFGRFVLGVGRPGISSRFGAICAGRYVSRIKRRHHRPSHRPATRTGKRLKHGDFCLDLKRGNCGIIKIPLPSLPASK